MIASVPIAAENDVVCKRANAAAAYRYVIAGAESSICVQI